MCVCVFKNQSNCGLAHIAVRPNHRHLWPNDSVVIRPRENLSIDLLHFVCYEAKAIGPIPTFEIHLIFELMFKLGCFDQTNFPVKLFDEFN